MRLWLPGGRLAKRCNVAAGDLEIRHVGGVAYIFSWSHFVACLYWKNWGLLNPFATDHFPLAGRAVQRMSGLRGKQFSLQKKKKPLRKTGKWEDKWHEETNH